MATREQQSLSEAINEIGLDKQNGASIGRLIASGNLAYAEERPDGSMRAEVRIPPEQLTWDPSVLVLPHGGDLEIEFFNDDPDTHCALLPNNGDYKWQWLPTYSRATVNINLDGPGYYWYSSNIGNDEGRGMFGAIVVRGEVPQEARLDRPNQPRP